MEEATGSKVNLEVHNTKSISFKVDCLPASLIIAVSLHIHHSLEALINESHIDENTISQTVDIELWSGEGSWSCWRNWNWC